MRRFIAVVIASVVVVAGLPLAVQQLGNLPAVEAHGVGAYYETYAGLDFRPLDSDAVVRYAGNGGGVWLKSAPRGAYMEATVRLPPGAQVTEVTFYLRQCSEMLPIATYVYLIGYSPSDGTFTYFLPETLVPNAACDATQTLSYPIDPPVTVDGSQFRYALGYNSGIRTNSENYDPDFVWAMLAGARVAYSIPGAFLPVVQN